MNHSGGKRQAKVLEEHYWDCSVCTYRNKAEAFKCLMCDVRKGTSTRKPRINPQLVAQQAQRNMSDPESPVDLSLNRSSSSSSESTSQNPQKRQRVEQTQLIEIQRNNRQVTSQQQYVPLLKPGKKETGSGSSTTSSSGSSSKDKRRRSRHPPRLKNIDRSTAQSNEVTVNNVTVVITEYKPKIKKASSDQSGLSSSASSENGSQHDSNQDSRSLDIGGDA